MKYLLDTSVYSQPIIKHPLPSVIARWKAGSEDDYSISVICELEVMYGIHLSGSATLNTAYEKILYRRFPVLPFNERCAALYAELQASFVKQGKPKPAFDLMIAVTALAHDFDLATCNSRDFEGIEGLRVSDWSV